MKTIMRSRLRIFATSGFVALVGGLLALFTIGSRESQAGIFARCRHGCEGHGTEIESFGDVGGMSPFTAPEQITAFRECKPTVDQYSVGATLYHLVTGNYVLDFPSKATEQLMVILMEDPVPILHRRPDLPSGLAEIIHRSLARDPKNRFPDVWTMRAALAEFA